MTKPKSKSKQKPVDYGSSITKNRCRGEHRKALERVISDADVKYVLQLTRDQLRTFTDTVREQGVGVGKSDVAFLIGVMHRLFHLASADKMDHDYVYASVVAEEENAKAIVDDPIGMSLRTSDNEYLLNRAVESMTTCLNVIRKTALWPADGHTALSTAALAVCFVLDRISNPDYTENRHAPDRVESTDRVESPVPLGNVELHIEYDKPLTEKKFLEIIKCFEDLLQAAIPKKPDLTPTRQGEKGIPGANISYESDDIGDAIHRLEEVLAADEKQLAEMDQHFVCSVHPTAIAKLTDDKRYQIVILPLDKKISRIHKTLAAAWRDAAAKVQARIQSGDESKTKPKAADGNSSGVHDVDHGTGCVIGTGGIVGIG